MTRDSREIAGSQTHTFMHITEANNVSDFNLENPSSLRNTNDYKVARDALLNDIVPPEDYNPKTSK